MLTLHVSSDTGLALLLYLANLAVASLLIGAATLLAHRLTRRLSLPLRHTLLLCGLVIAVASPLLIGLVELADCSLVGIAVQQEQTNASRPIVALPPPALPPMNGFVDAPFDESVPQPILDIAAENATPAVVATSQPEPTRPSVFETLGRSIRGEGAVFWASIALLVVWLIGSGYQLYRLAQGARYVRKLLGATMPIDDRRICEIANCAAQSVGLRRLPELCQSPDIAAPLSVGLFRPRIVLPRCEACDWSDDQWRFLLLHEMAHLQRRDLWVGLLQRFAMVIHWWNPLLHHVSTAISMVREQICDDVVAQRSSAAEGYPALIVELASRVFDRPTDAPVLGATDGSEHELLQRVRRMLDPNRRLITSLNARTLGIPLAFAAILLLSLTGASVHRATASAEQVEAPQVAAAPDNKPKVEASNAKAEPKPPVKAREELTKTVRVVDAAGNPIAGATVVPWAMQVGRAHGVWMPKGFGESEPPRLTTDQDGKATIRFPRFAQQAEKNPPRELTCRVSHPDFAASIYNNALVTAEELGNVTTIVLHAGAQIEAAALVGEKRLPADQVRALWSSPTHDGVKNTTVNAAGWLVLPRLPAGAETVQLVHLPKEGPVMFSRAETLQLADGDRRQLTAQMEPAVRVVGRLEESAARPIKNGRVVVEVLQRRDGDGPPNIEWRSWAPIAEDGSFVLEALPRGDLQVIALCDGYMAKSGAMPSFANEYERLVASSFARPQVFPLTKETNEITVAMQPTADCVIHVVGPDNRPVIGANAGFWPNVAWWGGGSQIYAFPLYRSQELLTNPERVTEALKADQQPFSAVTDKDGKATVHNLPSGDNVFTVLHDDLGLPPDAGQNRFAKIDLKPGQPNEVTVTLVPKNPTPPAPQGNAEARKLEPPKGEAQAEAPAKVDARPPAQPREMRKKTVRVVDGAGNPIAGATVTAWAMRVNQLQRPWSPEGFGESEPPVLTTDQDGKATIPFPRFAQQAEKNPPQALTFRVSHPDYIESANNDAVLTAEELANVTTVALYPGALIEAAAMVGDKRLPSEQVRALWSSPMGDGFQGVRVNAAGLVTLPRLPAGSELVQLVYRPKDGPAMFSRAETLTLTEGTRVRFTPQMERGVQVVGRLDESATRPIKNGRVVVQVMQRSADSTIAPLTWRSWAPIAEDGTFVFDSLPRGDLQLIALCDGYMAESGQAPDFVDASKPNAIAGASLRPQVFPLTKEINETVVAMTSTADCTVRALGPDNRPVTGAKIVTWPNVTWWGGDILSYETYAFPLYRTDELLDNPKIRIEARKAGHPFSATTDAEGIATIKNLPARETGFSASFPVELVPNRMTGVANVSLKAGQPNEVIVPLKSASAKGTPERLTKTVRVVDVAGKPVAGAKIAHVSTLFDGGYGLGPDSGSVDLTTDGDGIANVSFNRYPHTKQYSRVELLCRVFHPGFAPSMDNNVPASGAELKSLSTIVLHKGARIEAAAYLGEERLPIERTFALWSSLAYEGYKDASVNEQGWLQLPPLAPGREKVQLVYIPKEGPVMFSQIEKVELADNQRPQLRLQMEPSKRLIGKVGDSVRRPVKNGFAIVQCFQISDAWGNGSIRWQSWAPIAEDGSFAIESLPSGYIEAAGFCDAYMPTAVVLEESQSRDTVQLKKETTEITLRMTPTTDCAVRVLGPDNRPVAGAYCSFDSQTRRNAANFVYGFQLYRSQDLLADPQRWRDAPRLGYPFSAWTDAEGVAVVRNVGGDQKSFRVSHPTSRSLGYYGFTELEWGKRNETTVTLTADR